MQSEKQIAAAQGALGRGGVYVGAELVKAALEAALSATEQQPAPSVAVKTLEWNPYRAETPFGWYQIEDQRSVPESELTGRPPFLLFGSRLDYSRHPTLEAARAAAQADYEARIRSALSAQVQDVAGWQDISTLEPKDGMIVMGWGEYRERDGFSPAFMRWYDSVGGWSVSAMPFYPTHWMPLPSAPAAPAKQEGKP